MGTLVEEDRASPEALGRTLGEIDADSEEEEPLQAQGEDAGQGPEVQGAGQDAPKAKNKPDNLAAYVSRLHGALDEERRVARVLEQQAAKVWTEQARDMEDPSEYLAPFLSRCPPSSMPLEVKRASLDATEKAAGEAWKCKQFKRRVKEINDDYGMTVEWNAVFAYESFPEVILAVKFDAEQEHLAPGGAGRTSSSSPTVVKNVEVAFSDSSSSSGDRLLVLPGELEPLSAHCRRCAQPRDALTAFERYLAKSATRMEAVEKRVGKAFGEGGGVGVRVQVDNEEGVQLCSVEWRLTFKEDRLDFSGNYVVDFTEEGAKSARECSLPESLVSSGRCPDWSAEYCFRNLETMAQLDGAECEQERSGEGGGGGSEADHSAEGEGEEEREAPPKKKRNRRKRST